MINRLIKNEKDYNDSLSRIETLLDAKPGSAEMDELELLTALVEMYEERHYPISPPDPIDAIQFRMEQMDLSRKDMVPYIGNKSKVSEILNRKRPLTLAMMRALNKGLGIPAEVLLKEPGANFPDGMPETEWSKFPVAEMVKRCWIPEVDNIREKSEELMRDFIEQAGGLKTASTVLFRKGKSARYNSKTDPYALTAWCLRVLSLARKTALKNRFTKGSVKLNTLRDIARLSYFENGPLLAGEYLGKKGIHLIMLPHLPKTFLDGAAMLMPDGTPVIGLTLRHDRIDHFWFSLLHEMVHIAKHLSSSEPIIVDDLDLRRNKAEAGDKIETEADEMACDGLMPNSVWKKRPIQGKATAEKVRTLAEKLQIHPAVIAGRIRFERNNYKLLSKYIGNGQIRKHFPETC